MWPRNRSLLFRIAGAAPPLTLLLVLVCARAEPAAPNEDAAQPERATDLAVKPTGADARAAWPMFGGTIHRNLANRHERAIPESWSVGEGNRKNVKWVAKLGDALSSNLAIAGGRIFVGTNNENPRDPSVREHGGVLMCFDERTGTFLWQAVHDHLDTPETLCWLYGGIAPAPAVDGGRVYYVSDRCELVCADVEGDPKTRKARIVWSLDMVKHLNVYPHRIDLCSPLVVGDLVFVVTGNGVDGKTTKVKHPDAPSFVAVNKRTGEVVWKDSSPGKDILEGQWGSPAAAEVKGVTQVIFPGGDGWLYAFEAKSGKLLWKFDCNPKAAVNQGKGKGDKNSLLATPVVHDNKLYIGTGQNPEYGPGPGHLWCVDITKVPKNKDKDLSPVNDNFDPKAEVNKDSGLVWHFGGPTVPRPKKGRDYTFGRTVSTVAVHDGLVYAAELDGYLHCLDARTGEAYWVHDMKYSTWASPYYVDGKVYLGTEEGDLLVFRHGKEKKLVGKIEMERIVRVPVTAANGVLYVNDGARLYAVSYPDPNSWPARRDRR
jgi:outer membrane protein assembly factor BamB